MAATVLATAVASMVSALTATFTATFVTAVAVASIARHTQADDFRVFKIVAQDELLCLGANGLASN